MPLSNVFHMPPVVMLTSAVPNARILDVGIGMGNYGLMLRHALDVGDGHVDPRTWTRTIEGIEVFEQYRNPVWDYAYNRVHMGDIRAVLPQLGHYDVAVACDVLEHFAKDEARRVIAQLLDHADVLIATTPKGEWEQDAWGGNEAERHLCVVQAEDFSDLVLTLNAGATACYVCTRDPARARTIREAALACPPQLLDPRTRFRVRVDRKLRRLGRLAPVLDHLTEPPVAR